MDGGVAGAGILDRTERVSVAGLDLRVLDIGPEAPGPDATTLLVIPGHTARIDGFVHLVPPLAERHRVLLLDLPGSGESEKPDRRYDLRFYEDVLVAFLDERGVAEAVPVGGSLGGNLVLRLGHRFPERFPRLVLWAPGSAWTARPRLAAAIRATMGRWSFWPSVRIQSRYWYSPDFPGRDQDLADTFAYYRRVMSPGFVQMYWGLAADQVGTSLFDIAPAVAQRTLLMWGDQDHGGGMGRGVARVHQLLPDHRFHVFEGARHSIEAEIPDGVAATILAFLAETADLGGDRPPAR